VVEPTRFELYEPLDQRVEAAPRGISDAPERIGAIHRPLVWFDDFAA
jgi:hypothetical protein